MKQPLNVSPTAPPAGSGQAEIDEVKALMAQGYQPISFSSRMVNLNITEEVSVTLAWKGFRKGRRNARGPSFSTAR